MKKPISATIDEELINWIDKEINDTKKYRNKSHLIEMAIEMLKSNKKLEIRNMELTIKNIKNHESDFVISQVKKVNRF